MDVYFGMKDYDWSNAPLTSIYLVLMISPAYVLFIILHRLLPSLQKACYIEDVKKFVSIHNIILCLWSLWMFVGCFYEVVARTSATGDIGWLFCENSDTESTGWLWFYSYMYYISKYYELADTFLQLFAGKIPPNFFLHVYHHSLVIFMAWIWLQSSASMQFIGLLFNTAVHVVMYYYFYLKSIGITPKWKSWVTKFQIVQFVTSVVCFFITLYYSWSRNAVGEECKGMNVVYGSLAFNISLLYGFVGILMSGRKGSKEQKKSK